MPNEAERLQAWIADAHASWHKEAAQEAAALNERQAKEAEAAADAAEEARVAQEAQEEAAHGRATLLRIRDFISPVLIDPFTDPTSGESHDPGVPKVEGIIVRYKNVSPTKGFNRLFGPAPRGWSIGHHVPSNREFMLTDRKDIVAVERLKLKSLEPLDPNALEGHTVNLRIPRYVTQPEMMHQIRHEEAEVMIKGMLRWAFYYRHLELAAEPDQMPPPPEPNPTPEA